MNIFDSHEISENHSFLARRFDKIHRQEKVKITLQSEKSTCSDDLDKYYKILGKYYSDCILNDNHSDNNDINMLLAFVLSNLAAIDACNELREIIEDDLIQNIIVKEKIDHERGMEWEKITLQEQLAYEEIGEIEYEFGIFNTNLWFENFDKIKSIRLLKREKQITWEEMETQINELLQINHD